MVAASPLRQVVALLVASRVSAATGGRGSVTVQPWCENSARVRVTPPTLLNSAWEVVEDHSMDCAAKEEGIDQVGGHPLAINGKPWAENTTEAECCALCVGTPQCSVWVTDWQGRCYVVQGYTGKRRAAGRTAGFVRLRSPPPPGALITECGPGKITPVVEGDGLTTGNLRVALDDVGEIRFSRVDNRQELFVAVPTFSSSSFPGYVAVQLVLKAGDSSERIYGLGQGNWTGVNDGCAAGQEHVVPLERNGQTVDLQQSKFHISIPFAYSSAGYGFLFNMQGYGSVTVGPKGIGGMTWSAEAALGLDMWVSALPSGAHASAAPLYAQYADATGHAPPLREEAMLHSICQSASLS